MPTEQEIETIIGLWNQNKTYGEIANAINGPKSTVQGWIQSLIKKDVIKPRTESVRTNTKKATEAKRTYDRERRLALNDLWFEKIEKMLREAEDSRTLRELATPYGVAMDKRSILEPMQSDTAKTGLEEMREAIHSERKNGMETSTSELQSG